MVRANSPSHGVLAATVGVDKEIVPLDDRGGKFVTECLPHRVSLISLLDRCLAGLPAQQDTIGS